MRIKEIFYDNWGNTPEIVCRFFRILEKTFDHYLVYLERYLAWSLEYAIRGMRRIQVNHTKGYGG